MDAAAKLGGGKTLGKDAQEVDRYGRTVASNMQPDKPTEASLALDAAKGDANARAAMDRLKPAPKRTESEQAFDAYAKFIGKTKGEDLTYAERQTFEQNKAKITSDQAYQQHMRERQYD